MTLGQVIRDADLGKYRWHPKNKMQTMKEDIEKLFKDHTLMAVNYNKILNIGSQWRSHNNYYNDILQIDIVSNDYPIDFLRSLKKVGLVNDYRINILSEPTPNGSVITYESSLEFVYNRQIVESFTGIRKFNL